MIEIPEKYLNQASKKNISTEELEKLYRHTLIDPYEPVGTLAAQSISEASTQATLRTKHIAGIQEARTSATLPRLIEIFDAHERAENPIMIVYLNPEISKDQEKVVDFAFSKLLEIKEKDVVADYDVDLQKQRIMFSIDKQKLEENRIAQEVFVDKLSQYGAKIEGNKLVVSPKSKEFHREALRIVNKVLDQTISGRKGISKVIIKQDKSTGEYYIMTEGSNLKDVLELSEIDYTRTYTNDVMETYEVLGIEAARNLIVEEALKAFENGGLRVDPRHIMLVADLMCQEGQVVGVTRYGITGRSPSILARMAFEMPVRHLLEAAVFHEKEEFKYVVNNIITNQIIPVGTGKVKVIVKEENGTDNK
jgi:DNA-directed RNA polymerase subunit A"